MKKTIGKTILFIFCVGVVIFLLLPFLQTENAQSAAAAQGDKPAPQIFTSNPLTSIVKKLAALFRKNEKQSPNPQQVALTNDQVNEKFGVPQYRASSENEDDPDLIASAGSNTAVNTGAGYEGDDEESWVLIPQTSPENSAPGMHEINIKDNAYENYLRQEKAASYNPALRTNETAVPYWKKLLNPITKFFAPSDSQAAESGKWKGADPLGKGGDLSAGDNLTGNSAVAANGLQRMKPLDLSAKPTVLANSAKRLPPSKEQMLKSTQRAFDLLTQESSFERTAEMWAAAKNPQPDQQGQREADKMRKLREFQTAFASALQTKMDALKADAQEIPAAANLEAILNGDCSASSLPKKSANCDEGNGGNAPTQDNILSEKQANLELFRSQTGYPPIQNLPITPVLGIAELPQFEPLQGSIEIPESLPEDQKEQLRKAQEQARQQEVGFGIAKFLYETNGCGNGNDCVWVANGIQNSPDLKDSVEKAGQIFVGDPAGVYAANEKKYVAYRTKDVPEEQRAQAEKQAREDYQKAAPAMIPYNAKQTSETQQNSMRNLKENKDGVSVFLIRNGAQAADFANMAGNHLFFFSQNNQGLQDDSSKEGQAVTGDLAQDANFYLATGEDIIKPTTEDTIRLQLLIQQGIEAANSGSGNVFSNLKQWGEQLQQQKK